MARENKPRQFLSAKCYQQGHISTHLDTCYLQQRYSSSHVHLCSSSTDRLQMCEIVLILSHTTYLILFEICIIEFKLNAAMLI